MGHEQDAKERWKQQYAEVAAQDEARSPQAEYALAIGYSPEELGSVPEGTPLGHGCGNPTALAELKEGEVVMDLGSGGGLDALLAARRVGKTGTVIGVDMTPEMVEKATENARKGDYENVEFSLGDIEHLPVEDERVDVVISNCVVNHVADKVAAFREVFRVLKPGGRLHIADLVFEGVLTDEMRTKLDKLWVEWLGAASGKQDYLDAIEKAGFREVQVLAETPFGMAEKIEPLRGRVASLHVRASK